MKLLRTLWGATLALTFTIGLLGVSNTARAQARGQEVPELQRDWTIRVGTYIFNSRASRRAQGTVAFSGIVERTVHRDENYDVNVGIGYHGLDKVYSIPITIMGIGTKDNLRYGIGTGYAFGQRINGSGTSGPLISLLLGYQARQGRIPLSLDLRYTFISGSNNELDGYSITLGAKF